MFVRLLARLAGRPGVTDRYSAAFPGGWAVRPAYGERPAEHRLDRVFPEVGK